MFDSNIDLFLYFPGETYQSKIKPYLIELFPLVEKMKKGLDENEAFNQHQVFRDYVTYCRWPIRQMEYSFFINNPPSHSDGFALDAGSGVTPFPYLLSKKGWNTFSIDIEAEQMSLLESFGE